MAAIDISNVDTYPYLYDGIQGEENINFLVSQFGGNYNERKVKGINTLTRNWSVSFIFKTLNSAQTFVQLLRDNASEVFLWRSPIDTTTHSYTISSWRISPQSPQLFTVAVDLQQWRGN